MKTLEDHTYECSKCGEVKLTLCFLEHHNREGAKDVRALHSIDDYGECQIAAEAGGVPTLEGLKNCPVISQVIKNKNTL